MKKNEPKFSCMDDCIHLKACRRIQKIGREKYNVKVARHCTEECTAYDPRDIVVAITPEDAMEYIRDNAYLIKQGFDEYDVFAIQDLEHYEFDCIPYGSSNDK